MQTARRGLGSGMCVCLASLLAWSATIGPALAQSSTPGEAKVLIRPKYQLGQTWRYNLKLSGATAWTPETRDLTWGKMDTDFTFGLSPKVIREDGACTFGLLGEQLKSSVEGPREQVTVEATPERAKLRVRGEWGAASNDSFLAKPMTMTFGPLLGYRFGTGLGPLAIYMVPHVDHRFWTMLTLAPMAEVAPGQRWQEKLDLPVPGAKGKPLDLEAKWQVTGWEKYRGQKVLVMALEAKLELKDTDLLLLNGDLIHIVSGQYQATGKVLWDVEHGLLCSAEAQQKLLLTADKPSPRALRSEYQCKLQLLEVQTRPVWRPTRPTTVARRDPRWYGGGGE